MIKTPLAAPVKSLMLAALLVLTACVTINIYFPAAAAEEAAGKIVEEVLGTSGRGASQPAPPTGEKDGHVPASPHWLVSVLDFMVPPAHAASPDFNIDTPAIRQIEARMKARHEELKPFYDAGALGFANTGLVSARDSGAVALRDRARLNKLVDAENKDRNSLYREIAKANGHPEWEQDVRSVFARQWVQKARGGWWVQDPSGGWRKK